MQSACLDSFDQPPTLKNYPCLCQASEEGVIDPFPEEKSEVTGCEPSRGSNGPGFCTRMTTQCLQFCGRKLEKEQNARNRLEKNGTVQNLVGNQERANDGSCRRSVSISSVWTRHSCPGLWNPGLVSPQRLITWRAVVSFSLTYLRH